MPFKFSFRTPRSSSLHRQAAIALYRALLTGTSSLPTTPSQSKLELSNIIRNRFKQNRHNHSKHVLAALFTAGYQAIDVLDSARAGNIESQQQIVSLLSTASPSARATPPTILPKPLRLEREKKARADLPVRPKIDILDRPLPLDRLTGRRHVPRLFNAAGIPVLRIKKPMSPTLSKIISSRLAKKDARWMAIAELEDMREIFRLEDEWDGMMRREYGVDGAMEPSWEAGLEVLRGETLELITREKERHADWAEKLQGVEDREREMFERERRERRRKAKESRKVVGDDFNKSIKDGGEPG